MDLAALETHRRNATTTSGPISYLDVGQGRPAVFIHGLLTNGLLWRHVICTVATQQRRCIALDLPGHGHTPPAHGQADVSLTGLARRVIELCNHLELDGFDLVANDTGGAVAQIAAAALADRLGTFTLTNCDMEGHAPPALFKPIVLAARLGLVARLGPRIAARRGRIRSVLRIGYKDVRKIPNEVIDAYARPALGTPTAARALARLITAISSNDLAAVRPQLGALRVPTLIVWGTADILFRVKWAHRLADLIPGTTNLVTIPGGRLLFPDERADEFVPVLQQHWEKNPI
jgi:pimeloyl-ACP methyl ester carboxylesterase